MSSQLNFYLTPTDQEMVVRSLFSEPDCFAYDQHGADDLVYCEPGRSHRVLAVLTTLPSVTIYFGRAGFAEPVLCSVTGSDKRYVDVHASELIEFDPCRYRPGVVVRGRFFYHNSFYSGSELNLKTCEFRTWAASVVRRQRRKLMKHDAVSYISGEIRSGLDSGSMRLVDLDFGR